MVKAKCRFIGRGRYHGGPEYYQWIYRDSSGKDCLYLILVTAFWKVGPDARK